jgi:anthranilate phosphoribosyltransferase
MEIDWSRASSRNAAAAVVACFHGAANPLRLQPALPAENRFMKGFTSERGLKFRHILRDIAKGRHGARELTREEARDALAFLFSDERDGAQVGAFLTAMRFKGATLNEYLGFFDAIYATSDAIRPKVSNLVNANGPYDGRKHFLQLGPATAIVASAAGVPMLLHSSEGLPPKNGVTSGQVLEALGIPACQELARVQRNIEETGFGFLHARVYCHGIERLRRERQLLFYRSLLHSCEVMINPGGAKRSVIGAAHGKFLKRFLEVQVAQGAEHVISVTGLDGTDELPLQPAAAMEYRDGRVEDLSLSPTDYGLPEREPLPCRPAEETAQLIRETFAGQHEAVRDAVIYNGAVRIYLGGKAANIGEGVSVARATIASGAALRQLQRLAGAGS